MCSMDLLRLLIQLADHMSRRCLALLSSANREARFCRGFPRSVVDDSGIQSADRFAEVSDLKHQGL
jgi:hypothetical protein